MPKLMLRRFIITMALTIVAMAANGLMARSLSTVILGCLVIGLLQVALMSFWVLNAGGDQQDSLEFNVYSQPTKD